MLGCRPARSPTNICQRGATSQRPGGRHTSLRVSSQPERQRHTLCLISQGDGIHYPVGHPLLGDGIPFLRLSTQPSSGGGRDALTLSRSSSLSLWVARPEGLLLLCLPPVDGGQNGLPTPSSTATAFGGCCGCGGGCRGPHSATSRLGAATGGRMEQQLPAEAGSVRSPQSAPVQPGTAWPGYRLRRRRGQSGIQEP